MPVGKKHQRSFRVVIDQSRHKLRGKNIEDLGWYNPHNNGFNLNNERIKHWLDNGAQPTDTVHNLLIRARILRGKKIPVHSVSKKKETEKEVEAEAATAAQKETETTVAAPSVAAGEETPAAEENSAAEEAPKETPNAEAVAKTETPADKTANNDEKPGA